MFISHVFSIIYLASKFTSKIIFEKYLLYYIFTRSFYNAKVICTLANGFCTLYNFLPILLL